MIMKYIYFDCKWPMRLIYLSGHSRKMIAVRAMSVLQQTGIKQVVRFVWRKLL